MALDLNLALLIHGGFEGIVGMVLLVRPSWVFPYIARRASYQNSEKSLLRWFAFSIIVQGLIALAAALHFDAKSKRYVLAAFLAYHAVIVLDALYGYQLEGTMDEAATGLHAIMALLTGYFLLNASTRARASPRKGR